MNFYSGNEELEIEAFGRVQAIGFRLTIRGHAVKNGLRGFVLNRENGSVLIVAQGNKKKLKEFLSWLNASPGFSRIDTLKYSWRKEVKDYEKFEIIRKGNFISEQARNFYNLGKYVFSKKYSKVPVHIAIIPDGNRRWAKEKGLHGEFGHYKAINLENFWKILSRAEEMGVKYLDFWGFSTENWKRNEVEKNALFKLIKESTDKFADDADEHNWRFKHIGRKDRLPKELIKSFNNAEKKTEKHNGLCVQFCIDYGGRDEIIRAVNRILKEKRKKIDEKEFKKYLDTGQESDVDLIIRTSGEQRTSGFMPYQSTYAELYFVEKHFPDFTVEDLEKAIEWYSNRDRRFGGNSK